MPADQQPTLLSDCWEEQARRWIEWARKPGHDSYWQFHRQQFFQLLPQPGELTVDIGCGEGRVTRDLQRLGHRTIGIEVAPTLLKAAQEADPDGDYRLANAASLPLENARADLVVAFMSLHDVDDLPSAVAEAARVLKPGSKACVAIVHPLNSAGSFASEAADSPFTIAGSYLDEFNYSDTFSRDGLEMTFHSRHRSLHAYSQAIEAAGLLIEAIREHKVSPEYAEKSQRGARWLRVPMFMHLRLVKPA